MQTYIGLDSVASTDWNQPAAQAVTDTPAGISPLPPKGKTFEVSLYNVGPDTVYVQLDGEDCDVTKAWPILKDGAKTFAVDPANVSLACGSGDNAEVRVALAGVNI